MSTTCSTKMYKVVDLLHRKTIAQTMSLGAAIRVVANERGRSIWLEVDRYSIVGPDGREWNSPGDELNNE